MFNSEGTFSKAQKQRYAKNSRKKAALLPKSKNNADENTNESGQIEYNENDGQDRYCNQEKDQTVLDEAVPFLPIIERDYKSFNPLKIPQEGLHIAFKMLEMSELFTPEISNYKEAYIIKVENFGRTQKFVTLALVPMFVAPANVKDSWGPKLNDKYKTKLAYDSSDIENEEVTAPVMEIIREDWDGLIEPLKIGNMPDDIQI